MFHTIFSPQYSKLIERLFVFADTTDLTLNQKMNLVVNPEILKIIFKQSENQDDKTKIKLLKFISQIYKKNSFSSLILVKRDKQIQQFNNSIFQSLLTYILKLKIQTNQVQEIINIILPFLTYYPINCKIIKTILYPLIENFYKQKMTHSLLKFSINLLSSLLQQQPLSYNQIGHYFITYGQQSGLYLIDKTIKWPFYKGFYVYIKFYIEDFLPQNQTLFNIATEKDQFSIIISSQGELKIKVFQQQKYITISQIQKNKWIKFSLSYTLKSKLLRNFYQIHCTINQDIHERRDLPVPNISMTQQITQLSFGHSFFGRIASVLLSRTQIINGHKNELQNWKNIQNLFFLNKKNTKDLFIMYSPIFATNLNKKQIIYQITSQNHALLIQNTGVYVNPFKDVDINYYAGLYTYLPFLHLLKFYNHKKYPEALTDTFKLYYTLFRYKFGNIQAQAINCQFFSIACQLINEIHPQFINIESVQLFSKIYNSLQNLLLRKQMFLNFITKINLRRIQDHQIVQSILAIIQQNFLQSYQWTYGLMSIDAIFHYVIDNFQIEGENCCFYHYTYAKQKKQDIDYSIFNNNYLFKIKIIKVILKIVFINLVSMTQIRPIQTKIMNILFYNYSPCLKLLLLQTIKQGVKTNAKFYIEDFNLLHYVHLFLEQTQLPQQLATICQIYQSCIDQNDDNNFMRQNIIHRLFKCFDKIYTKKCIQGRFRSRTDRIRVISSNHSIRIFSQQKRKQNIKKTVKSLQKISYIETSKHLYDAVMRLCFYYDTNDESWLLISDDYISVIQPYFKVCSLQFKKQIIDMIRNTVILASHGKSILDNLTKFDKVYRLLLTEFVLKQLQPDSIEYSPSQKTNYIIRNVYFIIDYMVMGMRNDWIHLYIYLLRLIGLLQEAKKNIKQKTNKSQADIQFSIKVSMRKFLIRVVKLAQKDVINLPNLIFLVYLVVFANKNQNQQGKIFSYYKALQKHLFIGGYQISSSQQYNTDQITFVDSKLILQTVNSLKVSSFQPLQSSNTQIVKLINAFLDIEYTNQHSQLYKNRLIYLVKAQFRSIKIQDASIQKLISQFFGQSIIKDVFVGQIMSVLICVCLQSAVATKNIELLKQTSKSLLNFFFWFILLCSRDGLKFNDEKLRNKELPCNITFNLLHFLFEMANQQLDSQYIDIIQGCIYQCFVYLGCLIEVLNNKLGNPQTFQKGIQISKTLRSVQQYNYFTYDLLKDVLSIKDIINIPDKNKQKVIKLIRHPKVVSFFKKLPTMIIEQKIEQASNIHKNNVTIMRRQIQQQFSKINQRILQNNSNQFIYSLNQDQFKKVFVFQHSKLLNVNYRNIKRIWRKIWKRLRLYHYYWSVSLNQRDNLKPLQYQKNITLPYKHKFSKFLDTNGVRPILQVQPLQPWHVKKVLLDKQFEYRSSNYLYNLHQENNYQKRPKSFFQKYVKTQLNFDSFYVDWIKNNSKRKGYLSIQNQKLKFKYHSTYQKDSHLQFTSFILAQYKPTQKFWPLIQIKDIIQRRYLNKRQCLLIQLEDDTCLIFNFLNNDKDQFLKQIQLKQSQKIDKHNIAKLNKISFFTKKFNQNPISCIQQITKDWLSYKISNFKYLMFVNKYAGRCYLDPANYPVFPWIIASYNYKQIQYRNLSASIGGLGSEQRKQFYKNKLQSMDPFDPVPPYQFGTHYSSPGMVFNFLIRLQPYTQASRTLQGGRFDLADRLFSSMRVCWNSVNTQVSDVRQLVPQFFYLPQCLLNIENHNLGITQTKERVHNVQLPYWSQSAYDFIAIHRKQLQSDYVSENIGNWIDLIFGYKQKGKIAEQNLNLFFYLTYQNSIDLDEIEDEQTKISKQAQIIHFGQTPSQLWTKPHPHRQKSKKIGLTLKKINLLLSLQTVFPISILNVKQDKITIFNKYNLIIYQNYNTHNIQQQIQLLRNNSKQHNFYLQEIQTNKKIKIFGNQKYLAICSYINGDLIIFSLPEGKKISQKKGPPKNCLYINQKQDLILVGCKNGLFQVYQIVYQQKGSLSLIKIVSQYYMAPINYITQAGKFYSICAGSMLIVIRVNRTMNYIYNKYKMRGVKMIRTIQVNRKIQSCLIITEPLFSFIIATSVQIFSYSANGQLLVSRQLETTLPLVKITQHFTDYVAIVHENRLKILTTPFLKQKIDIQLPIKVFRQMSFYQGKCYLVSNYGQIISLSQQIQVQS